MEFRRVDGNLSLPLRNGDRQALIVRSLQIALIHQISQEINQEIRKTLDLDDVLNCACRLLGQTLGCDRVYLLIAEVGAETHLTTRGEYQHGSFPSQLGAAVAIADLPVQQFDPNSPTPEGTALILPAAAESDAEDLPEHLMVALRYQTQLIGLMQLYRSQNDYEPILPIDEQVPEGQPWQSWERELIESVGGQLAIAIHQARLYRETRYQAEREAILRLITNQIHQSLDLPTILQTAVREVRQFLKTSRVVVYQFFEDWQGATVVEDVAAGWRSILGEMSQDSCFSGDYAHLYAGGRVRAIHNVLHSDLDPCHIRFLQQLQVQANLIVPILIESKLWGLLIAHECQGARVWHSWETDLLQQLATQMAIAIQQASLYAQVQAAAAQSQTQAEQLQSTLAELQATQMQLVQTEKLSSLGQMVAGIAHEINNATTFIHNNLPFAQSYAALLEQAIALYEAANPDLSTVADLKSTAELDYVRQDFPKLLRSMQEGTERIREIVLTLRNFSRLDQAERKPVDLHEGIESTLIILQHRLKTGVRIVKQYGALPLVECNAGQINQVFLNLLSNALDASGANAEIAIRTWQCAPDRVAIAIRDSGTGIPPELQSRIFDPFFTTKDVGKGTGLGLSICHQIICRNHRGQLRCISQPGEGAEFQIELPCQR